MKKRIVVTGIGLLTPLGRGVDVNWNKIISGISGIGTVSKFDISEYKSKIAGEIKDTDFDATQVMEAKRVRQFDPFIHYGIAAGQDAIKDSGLTFETEEEKNRAGIIFASGIGGITSIYDKVTILNNQGPSRLGPFTIPSCLINMVDGFLSLQYGLQGPNNAVSTACASGTHAISDAVRMILCDEADVMVCGGAEACVSQIPMAGFAQMHALSTKYNEEPEKASRPWDKDRDGFVMAEGAGALVLEEYEHAMARGAKIYAEIIGYGMSGDAFHITAPGNNGAYRCMKKALEMADIKPEQVDYINAHGTSTPTGDLVELEAVKLLFKGTDVSMSSTKSMTGHMLGAAGAVEAIYTILAMNNNILPPTINLDNPVDEAEGIDLVPNKARNKKINIAMSNGFGFGGTNGTILFKKV